MKVGDCYYGKQHGFTMEKFGNRELGMPSAFLKATVENVILRGMSTRVQLYRKRCFGFD